MAGSELKIDVEKSLKVIGEYFRDYIFAIMSIAASPFIKFDKLVDGTADAVLKAENPKTWVFTAISTVTGTSVLHTAMGRDFSADNLVLSTIAFALWLGFLFAIIVHLISKVFRSKAKFLDTLGICLRVIPTAFLIAALIAMTGTMADKWWFATRIPVTYAHWVFVGCFFVLLVVYLPVGLYRAHTLSAAATVAAAFVGSASAMIIAALATSYAPTVENWIRSLGKPPKLTQSIDTEREAPASPQNEVGPSARTKTGLEQYYVRQLKIPGIIVFVCDPAQLETLSAEIDELRNVTIRYFSARPREPDLDPYQTTGRETFQLPESLDKFEWSGIVTHGRRSRRVTFIRYAPGDARGPYEIVAFGFGGKFGECRL